MYRTAVPVEPEWPVEHRCPKCEARVYVVTSQDGDDVTLDVNELEVRASESGIRATRRVARHSSLRHWGGYRLCGPELFSGWSGDDGSKPTWHWQWFGTRMTLQDAEMANAPIHSEHVVTCQAVSMNELLARLTNVAVTGSASGDHELARRTRRLRLEERRQLAQKQPTALVEPAEQMQRGQLCLEFAAPKKKTAPQRAMER